MTRKRSRSEFIVNGPVSHRPRKRAKVSCLSQKDGLMVKHLLLSKFYPTVLSLRQYMISKLPQTSKARRRKINRIGNGAVIGAHEERDSDDMILSRFLDETLVGVAASCDQSSEDGRQAHWTAFSQTLEVSRSTIASTVPDGGASQSEVSIFS